MTYCSVFIAYPCLHGIITDGVMDLFTDPTFRCEDPERGFRLFKEKRYAGGIQVRDRIIRICQDQRLLPDETDEILKYYGYKP